MAEYRPVYCMKSYPQDGEPIFKEGYEYKVDSFFYGGGTEARLGFCGHTKIWCMPRELFTRHFMFMDEGDILIPTSGPGVMPRRFLEDHKETPPDKEPPPDEINALAPTHYNHGDPYEVIKVIEAWGLDRDAYLFNVIKYVARAGKKHPEKYLEDLRKAQYYLNRRIESCMK